MSYCDVNKYDYGHIAPLLFISDYDWRDETTITADPRRYFSPIGFEFDGFSMLWRLACPECAEIEDSRELYRYADAQVYEAGDEFEVYDYDFLAVEGHAGRGTAAGGPGAKASRELLIPDGLLLG